MGAQSADLSKLSTEDLLKLRGATATPAPAESSADLSKIPTTDLLKLHLGIKPKDEGTLAATFRNTKDALLSLAAPGGTVRLMGKTAEDFDHAAYDAGDKVNEQANKVLPAPVAAALGTATNVGIQSLPMLAGGEAKAAAPMLEAGGKRLMGSALGTGQTWAQLKNGDAAKAITTMLDKGYNASKGGVSEMKARISELADQVKTAIGPSREMVNSTPISAGLTDLLKKYEAGTLSADSMAAIKNTWKQLLDHPYFGGSDWMTVQEAQAMKQANYRQLGDRAYGAGLKPEAERDALKTITEGLKDEIARKVPAVAAPNEEMSQLINAKNMAERRVLMDSKTNPIPLGASIATVAHDPMAALGLWANSSAYAKSILARLLYSGQEAIPASAGRAAGGTLGALLGRPDNGKRQ